MTDLLAVPPAPVAGSHARQAYSWATTLVYGNVVGLVSPHGGVASSAIPAVPFVAPPHELAFAAAIRAARVEAGRTQADVAAEAGLSVRVVQRTEQGQRRINPGETAGIAQALGRSLDELVKVSETATFEQPRMGRPRRGVRP